MKNPSLSILISRARKDKQLFDYCGLVDDGVVRDPMSLLREELLEAVARIDSERGISEECHASN